MSCEEQPEPTGDSTRTGQVRGLDDAAAAALARARAVARDKGLRPGAPGRRRATRTPGTGPGFPVTRSRDPQAVGEALKRLVAAREWSSELSVGGVTARWPQVVGREVAEHATPETFTDGRLVVRASSTAWATQLRLLLPQIERRIAEEVGDGVVQEITIIGPGAPTWRYGNRVVKGRGPRDTYG
ncbi:DUF721 domain-containing protein [Serinibacter salmoneus]|uniref:Putative nucleic acid-binding Zn ribbon protein n=1 Tax=Serinibacter salmoneus TaxID=556530 RepID=A0A2A9D493_9MICO|nr:DciA family protein [Serinibacter salmoneus]PFG21146.1 putative nucleic acid-binding Zn ribbon protein [Serinibacter salmoneus]